MYALPSVDFSFVTFESHSVLVTVVFSPKELCTLVLLDVKFLILTAS